MKKGVSVLLAGILMISFAGCEENLSEKLEERYQKLESYTASAVVTVTGNKGLAVYEMEQSYQAPDSYRMEVLKPHRLAGTVTVIKGEEQWLKSGEFPAASLEVAQLKEETDFFFPMTFLQEFLDQEPVPQLTKGADGTILLTAPVKDANQYRFHQNLILDGESLLPRFLITYDKNGNETVRTEFRDFVKNAEVDKKFRIQ